MRCEQAEIEISELLDRELDDARRSRVEAHLAECAPCRRRHRLLAATRDAFRELDPDPAPSGFEGRLRDRLATQPPAPQRPGARRWLPAIALAAAAAIATLALSLLSPAPRTPEGSAPATVAPEARHAAESRPLIFEETAASICGLSGSADCRPIVPCSSAAECGLPLDAVGVELMSM